MCVKAEDTNNDGGSKNICQPSYYNQECNAGYTYCENEDFDETNTIEPIRCVNIMKSSRCTRKAIKGKCYKSKMKKKCQKACKSRVSGIDCHMV